MLQALCINRAKKLTRVETASEIARLLRSRSNLLWVDITNPEEDDIDILVEVFRFHQLAIEDAIFPQNQPKLESYHSYLHVVVHELSYPSRQSLEVGTHELNIFIGRNFVVTSHLNTLVSVSKLFQKYQTKTHSLQPASDFLLHAIIDQVVDGYFPVIDQLEQRIEKLEDEVLAGANKQVLEKIVEIRKNILTIRNFIQPQRKILNLLGRSNTPFVSRSIATYFRDVYDHVVRISDMLDTYRDVLASTMDAYVSVVSLRMNEIIKTLTTITTILMPLTVITSFYGMNVKIPEFELGRFGYYISLGLLVLALTGMVIFLKRKKWL
ncbi:MAG: magnesium/cobalt transporter CorA [candidate division FCPU426 bacterium]